MILKAIALSMLVAATCLATPSAAQSSLGTPSRPTIVVRGEGFAERPADYATITGEVRGEGRDQQAALRALAQHREQVEATLSRLAGVTAVRVETGPISFEDVLPPECQREDDYRSRRNLSSGPCAPSGVVATIEMTAEVRPATQLGALASLAVQSGVRRVSRGTSGVSNRSALRAAASAAAFRSARDQAQTLALAAGGRLGRVVGINREVASNAQSTEVEELVVTGSRIRADITPEVALRLTAPDATDSTWVIVSFELLP